MKKILLIAILITGVTYANNCDNYKRKAVKYEQMGMASSNLDLGAKYLKMSITNKKESINACFYSTFDKEIIYKDIKDMEEMRRDMMREATRKRKHELDVANQSADKVKINNN